MTATAKGADRSGLLSAAIKTAIIKNKVMLMRAINDKPKEQPKPKKKEKLSRKELEELMGMNMDRYARKNGAWRRR